MNTNQRIDKKDTVNLLMNGNGIFLHVNNDKYRLCSHPYTVDLDSAEETEFIRNYISPTEDVFVLKKPVNVAGVLFRLTLHFYNLKFLSISMAAVNKQDNELYARKSVGLIHDIWLDSLFGQPKEKTIYGAKYVYDTLEIRKTYDVKTNNTAIIMHYPYSDKIV